MPPYVALKRYSTVVRSPAHRRPPVAQRHQGSDDRGQTQAIALDRAERVKNQSARRSPAPRHVGCALVTAGVYVFVPAASSVPTRADTTRATKQHSRHPTGEGRLHCMATRFSDVACRPRCFGVPIDHSDPQQFPAVQRSLVRRRAGSRPHNNRCVSPFYRVVIVCVRARTSPSVPRSRCWPDRWAATARGRRPSSG